MMFTVENNQFVRQYLEALQVDLYEDYINGGKKLPEPDNTIELAQMKAINNVLEELDRNLQQIQDGIFR